MQTINLRYMLRLFGQKSLIIFVLVLGFSLKTSAQHTKMRYQAEYDNKKYHFGYLIGVGLTHYAIKTNAGFATSGDSSYYALVSPRSYVLRLGGVLNVHLNDFFDFRTTPSVSLPSYRLEAIGLANDSTYQDVSKAWFEIPVAIKYKSERRGNVRMYVMGGLRYGIETNPTNLIRKTKLNTPFNTKKGNFSVEYGVGLEWFMRYFKFTPELQFSHGIRNMLRPTTTDPGVNIARLTTHNVTLFLMFE